MDTNATVILADGNIFRAMVRPRFDGRPMCYFENGAKQCKLDSWQIDYDDGTTAPKRAGKISRPAS